MNLVSCIFSIALFFSLSSHVLLAMEPVQESGQPKTVLKKRSAEVRSDQPAAKKSKASPIKIEIEVMQCLKQGMVNGHGLHCGYYALWHALCALDPSLKDKICNQKSFYNFLGKYESCIGWARLNKQQKSIFEKGKYALGLISIEVDNLELNELDLLTENYCKHFADQITVVPSVNYLERCSKGLIQNQKLFTRIANFKERFQTQLFIINTGQDKGVRAKGTNHWIAVALNGSQDMIKFSIYDSGFVSEKGTPDRELQDKHYKNILNHLHQLFIVQDIALVQARSILNDVRSAVNKYLEAAEKNPESWVYVSMLEDYCFELYVIALESCDPNNPFDQQKKISLKKDLKRDARESFGMNAEESSGVISPDYVNHLQTVTIPQSLGEFKKHATKLTALEKLFESGYAYEPGKLYDLAVRKIEQAYVQAQDQNISCEIFINAAEVLGFPLVIINQALGIVPDQAGQV